MGWVLIDILSGVPLIRDVAPVRVGAFFGFRGCFSVWDDVVRGRCLFGWVC